MPSNDLLTQIPAEELTGHRKALITELTEKKERFDFSQDIQLTNGSYKPLQILLTINEYTNKEMSLQIQQALSMAFRTQAVQSNIMENALELTGYVDFILEGHPIIVHAKELASMPSVTSVGMFHQKKELKQKLDTELLHVNSGKKGIEVTPAKFAIALSHDTVCAPFYDQIHSDQSLMINTPVVNISLKDIHKTIDDQVQQLEQYHNLKLTVTMIAVEVDGHYFELLLALQRMKNRELRAMSLDILGASSPVTHLKEIYGKIPQVHYIKPTNQSVLRQQYEGKPIYSCCGLLLNRIYHATDKLLKQESSALDIPLEEIMLIGDDAPPIELKDTITRANEAITRHITDSIRPTIE